jgi:hypothetical protein
MLLPSPSGPPAVPPTDGAGHPQGRDLQQLSDDGAPGEPDHAGWSAPDWRDNLGDRDTFDDPPPSPAEAPLPAGRQTIPTSPVEAPDRYTTYRVRYTCTGKSGQHRAADVESADIPGGLDRIPGGLPPRAYILSVEDLTGGRAVHWTRWPAAFRPGFGG